jgi:hypothetical protein
MRYLPAIEVDLIDPLVPAVGAHPDAAIAEHEAEVLCESVSTVFSFLPFQSNSHAASFTCWPERP